MDKTSFPVTGSYLLAVDYGRNVEDGVKAGRYDWVDEYITSRNFPTKRSGTAEVVVELIHFGWFMLNKEVLHELRRKGYRPAELHELLAFGEKYPDVQHKFPVVALGSVWRLLGFRHFPYLDSCKHRWWKRNLYLYWDYPGKEGWSAYCRFAAVRK